MDVNEIKNTAIFRGMNDKEIKTALEHMSAVQKKYKKGSVILSAGTTTDKMGLVLSGSVTIENNDIWGNRTILTHIEKNQFFAETYGLFADETLLVDAVANDDCSILFLHIGDLRNMVKDRSPWVIKFTTNLLMISAGKNLMLSGRSFHTAPKTVRARVMSYLNSVALKKGTTEFDIPFDRQQMADYLNLERTALSKELGKMKNDGLIDFTKNHFVLKDVAVPGHH